MSGVLGFLAVVAWLACGFASPTWRQAMNGWTRGVWQAMVPRGCLMGCLLWLAVGWLIGMVILAGWVALTVVAPVFGAVDLTAWLAGRHEKP